MRATLLFTFAFLGFIFPAFGIALVTVPDNCPDHGNDQPPCAEVKSYFEGAMEDRKSSMEILDLAIKPSVQLVLIGENHDHSTKVNFYLRTITHLAARYPESFDCVFLENDQRLQTILDQYMRNEIDFEKLRAGRFFDQSKSDQFLSAHNPFDWLNSLLKVQRTGKTLFFFDDSKLILELVRRLKLKVYVIDDFEEYNIGAEAMNRRNKSMAANIRHHFASGECKMGLMPIGKGHISERGDQAGSSIRPLPSILETGSLFENRLVVSKINLQSPRIAYTHGEFGGSPCSPWYPSIRNEEFGTLSKTTSAQNSYWRDFDATIFVPEK